MFKYEKKLAYPVDIKKKDLKMAKYLITQFGGPNGELGAAMRYFSQKFSMPDEYGKALLNDIATEELGHAEMICAMVHQLMKNATIEEIEAYGITTNYVEHGKGIYPMDASGNPFNAATFASTGDVKADLVEDMAAEQKARATYENLINITKDEDILGPLLFLRQREIIHYHRFKELFERYQKLGY